MATYQSLVYAQTIGNSANASGAATPFTFLTSALFNGGEKKVAAVSFNAALQNLNTGSIVYLALVPQNAIVTSIKMQNDTGTGSATIQIGTPATAGAYTPSAQSISSASTAPVELLLTPTNYLTPLASNTIIQALFNGANVTSGNFYFVIEYIAQ